MTVTQHGGTSSPAPMTANGMPFATCIGCATVVHVGTILVAVKPTWVGYSDGKRPRVMMSCAHAAPSAASNVSVVLFCVCEPARPESMFYRQDTTVSSLERLGEAGWLPDVRSEEL